LQFYLTYHKFFLGFISPPYISTFGGGNVDYFLEFAPRRPEANFELQALSTTTAAIGGTAPPAGVRVRSLFPESWIWTQGSAG